MSHFHIDLTVDTKDIQIIKSELSTFVEMAHGFSLYVESDSGVDMSPELEEVIKKLFVYLIVTLNKGHFRGIN